jgi:hypothetical protein
MIFVGIVRRIISELALLSLQSDMASRVWFSYYTSMLSNSAAVGLMLNIFTAYESESKKSGICKVKKKWIYLGETVV